MTNIRKGNQFILYKRGEKIGDCIFIEDIDLAHSKGRLASFQCRCGNIFTALLFKVKDRRKKGCGCREWYATRKHGHCTGERSQYLLNTFFNIKQRCYNKKSTSYALYGGRGIKVFKEWLNPEDGFIKFANYIGERPSENHTIDRYPNKNGNYEPGNIRWATAQQQARNRNTNRYITHNGETKTLAEWCSLININPSCVITRIQRGWDIGLAITKPPRTKQVL